MARCNLNILFSSAGRRVELIRAFRRAGDALGVNLQIIVGDLHRSAPTVHLGEVFEPLPPVGSAEYADAVLEICRKRSVRSVIPLIDPELTMLASRRVDFSALEVAGFISSLETMKICEDKRKTHSFFRNIGLRTPEIFGVDEVLSKELACYPLIIKPSRGSAGMGVTKINNRAELEFYRRYLDEPLLQEYLPGDEYTLDIFLNLAGEVVCVVPRRRIEIRAGEVSKGITVRDPDIIEAGKTIGENLPGAVGCITAQCFKKDKVIKFTEINARFGGGVPLAIEAGADFPGWIIQLALGRHIGCSFDCWRPGVAMLRYDAAVFVDRNLL